MVIAAASATSAVTSKPAPPLLSVAVASGLAVTGATTRSVGVGATVPFCLNFCLAPATSRVVGVVVAD